MPLDRSSQTDARAKQARPEGRHRRRRLRGPQALLFGGVGAFAAGFGSLAVLRHRAFESGRFDLGNMVQAVWSTSHGHPLEVTNLEGEQVSRLASHVDPLLAAFAPFWLAWPHPSLLLAAQATVVAIGAFPVFWLARKHLQSERAARGAAYGAGPQDARAVPVRPSETTGRHTTTAERAAVGFALAYLVYPPVQWLVLDDFHPVALACPLLLFAFWYLDEDRLRPFAAFAVAALLAKEEIGLVVAAMGLWYGLTRHRLRAAGMIAALGSVWSLLAIAIVIPVAGDGASDFYGRYEEVGGSPAGVLETAVTDPGRILSTAFDQRGVEYVAKLLLPLAGFALLAPAALLVALPELAINLLSSTPTQTSIHFHYTAGIVPALVAATVLGAGRIAQRRPRLATPLGALALVVALVANYRLGAMPFWREVPGGESLQADAYDATEHDRIAARGLDLIPGGDAVSATNSLGAHLSARRRVFSFPVVAGARWVALDERRPSLGDRLDPPDAPARISSLRHDRAWRIVFDRDGIVIFRRR